MSPSFAATMRRTTRLMRPRTQAKAIRKVQKAVANTMVTAAFAPLTALKPKRTKAKKPTFGSAFRAASSPLRAAKAFLPTAFAGGGRSLIAPSIPLDAQYLTRRHRGIAGARGYKLYLPASHPKRPKGLILMLHGCNQTANDFAAGTHMNTLAEKHGLAIAYPEQTKRFNRALCWNWFKPGNQMRGVGEPAMLAALTRKLMREFKLGRDNTFVAGLSAGGAMAVILADVYPDIFAAAGVHSGLARGSASNVISAMSAMRRGGRSKSLDPETAQNNYPAYRPVRRIVFQGDSDTTVHPSNAATIVSAALGDDAAPEKITSKSVRGRDYERSNFAGTDLFGPLELWMLTGGKHAWSGGRKTGSYTDSTGPDASAQMVRFFLAKPT